jgi:glutaredoxin
VKAKLFVRENCPKCPAAKALASRAENVEYYDVDNVDGLAEASFYGVMSTPSIVIVDDQDKEVISWRGEVPSRENLAKWLH